MEKGGSFYLQSKIYRARERFQQECKIRNIPYIEVSSTNPTAEVATPTATPVSTIDNTAQSKSTKNTPADIPKPL